MIGILPNGARGLDANTKISSVKAHELAGKGFQFAIRYVKRADRHDYDLDHGERDDILTAGLGLMVVQHVAPQEWVPRALVGSVYGRTAVIESQKAGIELGTMIWLDLEGVRVGTPALDVIGYCNNWHTEVWDAGYQPGIYVGWHSGLSAYDLYWKLKFRHYWGAYNLDRDAEPAVRGLQMQQSVAKSSDLIKGFTTETFDVDIIHADLLGGTPMLMFQ